MLPTWKMMYQRTKAETADVEVSKVRKERKKDYRDLGRSGLRFEDIGTEIGRREEDER